MLRAYKVSEQYEGVGLIVFAESHSKARALGFRWLGDYVEEYTEVYSKLEPRAEKYAAPNSPGPLFWPYYYHDQGWFLAEQDELECSCCGCTDWSGGSDVAYSIPQPAFWCVCDGCKNCGGCGCDPSCPKANAAWFLPECTEWYEIADSLMHWDYRPPTTVMQVMHPGDLFRGVC